MGICRIDMGRNFLTPDLYLHFFLLFFNGNNIIQYWREPTKDSKELNHGFLLYSHRFVQRKIYEQKYCQMLANKIRTLPANSQYFKQKEKKERTF